MDLVAAVFVKSFAGFRIPHVCLFATKTSRSNQMRYDLEFGIWFLNKKRGILIHGFALLGHEVIIESDNDNTI